MWLVNSNLENLVLTNIHGTFMTPLCLPLVTCDWQVLGPVPELTESTPEEDSKADVSNSASLYKVSNSLLNKVFHTVDIDCVLGWILGLFGDWGSHLGLHIHVHQYSPLACTLFRKWFRAASYFMSNHKHMQNMNVLNGSINIYRKFKYFCFVIVRRRALLEGMD